jgi:hypothetical protein
MEKLSNSKKTNRPSSRSEQCADADSIITEETINSRYFERFSTTKQKKKIFCHKALHSVNIFIHNERPYTYLHIYIHESTDDERQKGAYITTCGSLLLNDGMAPQQPVCFMNYCC